MAKRRRMKGEGAIYQRVNGKWCGELITGKDPKTGKNKRKFFYGDKQSLVKKKMEEYKKSLELEQIATSGKELAKKNRNPLLKDWISEWLITYIEPNLKTSTYEDYERLSDLYIIPRLGDKHIKDITGRDLQVMYNDIYKNGRIRAKFNEQNELITGLSSRTIAYVHAVCSSAFEQARRLKMIEENIALTTKLPKKTDKKNLPPFTLDEEMKFLEVCKGERLESAFWVSLGTGIRIGELVALKWENVNLDEGTFWVRETAGRVKNFNIKNEKDTRTILQIGSPKTLTSTRELPFPSAVLEKLKEFKMQQEKEKELAGQLWTDDGFVFTTPLGTMTDPGNITRRYRALLKKANLRYINFHILRHTFTTRLKETKVDFKVLQDLLGHADTNVTDWYCYSSMEMKKEAVEQINFIFEKNNSNLEDV